MLCLEVICFPFGGTIYLVELAANSKTKHAKKWQEKNKSLDIQLSY